MTIKTLYPNVRPTLDLAFAATKALDPRITFTRASTGTYVGSNGTLRTAGINEARFDHSPLTLESLGLLVEEARTNLLLQSQDFTTSWSQTNVTITPNTTISPDGSTNADTLAINVIAANTSQTTQTFTAGSTITVSVFAKKNTSNFIRFELGSLCSCWFNLDTGVTASNNAGSGSVLFSAKSIQSFGGGWYRCSLTVTTTTITTLGVSIFATNADNTTSSIGSSAFLWGAQTEVGAFPTSYIPTTSATVTRAADVASITGSNFSSWYNQTEGTVFAEYKRLVNNTGRILTFNDTTSSEQIRIAASLSTNIRPDWQVLDNSVVQANVLGTVEVAVGAAGKTAGTYKLNDFQQATNSTLGTADTTGTLPTPTVLNIGANESGSNSMLNGTIKRLTYWPWRLSNATLQALTS